MEVMVNKTFSAEGVHFRLLPDEFSIETSGGMLFYATLDQDKIWKSEEGDYYSDFQSMWEDVRAWIGELASTIWSEDKYKEFFIAVNAIFSTT